MKAYTYINKGRFELIDKPKPVILEPTDAIVRVTLSSICTSDLHIKHGSVPRAVPGITVGHEMVGVVEELGSEVKGFRKGDRVTVNVETFCGECYFCQHGYVNNCTSPHVSEISEEDTVFIIGAGPTGICALLCAMLKHPKRIIVCEQSEERRAFVKEHYPDVLLTTPGECLDFVLRHSDHQGADRVLEVAGGKDTFQLAWQCARPNAIVTVVALYDKPQVLPLPQMYGKNLVFKTGGVDGCDCEQTLRLIKEGKIDTTPLITHRFPLSRIAEAYELFEQKRDGVIKIAVTP